MKISPQPMNVRSTTASRPPTDARSSDSSVALIFADESGHSDHFVSGLSALGRRVQVAATPLDAIVRLEDREIPVESAFVSLVDPLIDVSAFFGYLTDRHPEVKRIAYARGDFGTAISEVRPSQMDVILWNPWERPDFVDMLGGLLDS